MKNISSLTIVLINPSRYDDEGYVIRYFRGVLPCNTLACMHSLTLEFADKWKAEKGIDIKIKLYDEVVDTIPFKRIAAQNKGAAKVVVAIVGVQSNQFPRASDIAKKFSALGVKTLIGGFHVSGVISLFGEPTPEIRELMDIGVTCVHGEAENMWEKILKDVVRGVEKPLYNMDTYPDISQRRIPRFTGTYMKKFALSGMSTLDCSRGCPFGCTFCTVINVQGHKMRYRSAECVLETIRDNYSRGIVHYFFTDDNFSRNPEWERIFDGLIHLIENEEKKITFMMQVDMRSHKIKNFIWKAARAGCTQVFIGMESINQKNLEAVGKTQNRVDDYAAFVDAWHKAGIMTHAGYIIGFPYDTPESVKEDIRRLKDEIKIDQASFFMLTPLPGSIDHYTMVRRGDCLESDLNKYDSFHASMKHPNMTNEEWFDAYNGAWESFYRYDNLKKVLMRAGRKEYWNIFRNIMWYKNSLLEPRHPMVAGFVRRKNRTDVRPGTRIMGRFEFAVMRIRELTGGFKRRISLFFELQELWLLTRKPADPTFRLVADFTNFLSDIKNRFGTIQKPDDLEALFTTLKNKTIEYCNALALKGKAKKRIEKLIGDMKQLLDSYALSEQYSRRLSKFTACLNTLSRQVEDFSLKHVARRRKITHFWFLTWDRIRQGKILSFTVSLPKIFVSAVRDFRLSMSFTYHLKNRNF